MRGLMWFVGQLWQGGWPHSRWSALLCLFMLAPAGAATYTFPGSLPTGCLLSVPGVYNCGTVNLGTSDTVNITGSAVINFTGGFSIQGSQVNAGGSSSNLTLNVGTTFSASAGGRVVGRINAGAVSTTGAQTYTGNIAVTASAGTLSLGVGSSVTGNVSTVNGALGIGGSSTITGNVSSGAGDITIGSKSTVSGSVTSSTGLVLLTSGVAGNYTTVGSISTGDGVDVHSYSHVLGTTTGTYVSGGSYPWFDGAVTSTSTYISFADHATVNGALLAASYVYTGTYATIVGNITANGGQVDLAGHSNVTGNISGSSYVFLGDSSTVDGNATSGTLQVDLYGHSSVTGSVTANGTYVNFGIGSSAGGAVQAKTYVDLGTGGIAGGSVTSQTSYVNGDSLQVAGAISASTTVDVHSDGTFGGNITAGGDITIYNNNTVTGDVTSTGGHVFINDYNTLTGNVRASGYVKVDDHTVVNGDMTSTGSYAYISSHSTINGNVTASTTMTVLSTSSIQKCARSTGSGTMDLHSAPVGGGCCGPSGTCTKTCISGTPKPADCQTLHHMMVTTPASSGNNCSTTTATVSACQDSGCTPYTWGVSGNLTASGAGMTVNFPSGSAYSIPYGSASTVPGVGFSTVNTGNLTLGATASSPTASSSTTCSLGAVSTCSYPIGTSGCSTVHHLEITTSVSSGLTCAATVFTIKACGDGASPCTPYTSGVTGNLVLTGTGGSTTAFTIATGSSTTTLSKQITKAGTVTASISSPSPAPSNTPPTYCGMGVAASSGGSCSFTTATSALRFANLGNHMSDVQQTGVTLQAVKSTSDSTACVPAFTGSKSINFSCAYSNPTSGTKAVVVGASASVACGNNTAGTSQPLSLTFNGSGIATTTVQYADVGLVRLMASYTGTAGVDADTSGYVDFIAAPYSFAVTGWTTGSIRAGSSFSATVTARSYTGGTTPNFGRETTAEGATLSFVRAKPSGATAVNGSASGTLGAFSAGSATSSNLQWSEVGWGDVAAMLSSGNYLGSGVATTGGSSAGSVLCASEGGTCTLPSGATAMVQYGASGRIFTRTGVTGSVSCSNGVFGDPYVGAAKSCRYVVTSGAAPGATGAVGPFIPHHFDVGVANACSSAFTYSGQPFTVTLTARNAANGTTQNYDGTGVMTPVQAQTVTLSAATNAGLGGFDSGTNTVPLTAFTTGVGSATTPVFRFTNKLTAPASVSVRGVDVNGASSSGFAEANVDVRSGRLRLTNKFGSEKSSLGLVAQAQHWSGKTWVLNSLDSCTRVPVASVALGNYLSAQGGAASTWSTAVVADGNGKALSVSGGNGTLTLAAPTATNGRVPTGTVDVGLNLGIGVADLTCLATPRPNTTGANLSWLRSQFGSSNGCTGLTDFSRDPSARATFGVYAPEVKRIIHAVEAP